MKRLSELQRTRAAARAIGDPLYFTEKVCPHGHIAARYSTSRNCVECQRDALHGWYRRNKNAANHQARTWRQKNPERARFLNLRAIRKHLGFPEPTRPKPKNCELCNRDASAPGKMHLDHDHGTGKFRGWLCNRCNMSLGHLGDSIEGIERALDYLKRAVNVA
jgi:hypothetical protein